MLENPTSAFNLQLREFDVLEVFSKDRFREIFNVSVEGAVRNPGVFNFAEGMTMKDVLYYAGGLKKEAANNKIEVARVSNFSESLNGNQPTRIIVETVEVGYDPVSYTHLRAHET